MRLFNPTPADVDASIAFGASTAAPLTAELVDSNEHPLAPLPVTGNAVSVRCASFTRWTTISPQSAFSSISRPLTLSENTYIRVPVRPR